MATYPNHPGKHALESMITPGAFFDYLRSMGKLADAKIPEAIIFCYQSSLLKYILANHKNTPAKMEGVSKHLLTLDETDGKIGIVGGFGIGAPGASTMLEEFIALGVKRFISIGTAGTLQKNITIGDVVVIDKAIRDEGVSHHYLPPAKYAHASKALTQKVVDKLQAAGLKHVTGSSWTTDAPYRETVAEARAYQQEGVCVVEMEAAALFAVAECRKVELASFVTISDSLAELKWTPHFYSPQTAEGLEKVYKVALDVLTK